MSNDVHEQLSAFADGELEAEPARFLLRRLASDAEFQDRWERYHVIREGLRGGLPRHLDTNFAARVRAAVEREAVPRARRRLPTRVLRPLAGLAVAAGVAAVAVFGFQNVGQPPLVADGAPLASAIPAGYTAGPTDTGTTVQTRLNPYLVNHSEYATGAGMHGMLSYVRIVGYEPGRSANPR